MLDGCMPRSLLSGLGSFSAFGLGPVPTRSVVSNCAMGWTVGVGWMTVNDRTVHSAGFWKIAGLESRKLWAFALRQSSITIDVQCTVRSVIAVIDASIRCAYEGGWNDGAAPTTAERIFLVLQPLASNRLFSQQQHRQCTIQ